MKCFLHFPISPCILAAPKAYPAEISCQTPNTVTYQLIASTNDTSHPPLHYFLQTHPVYGNIINWDTSTGSFTFQCTSLTNGNETLSWYAYDGFNTGFSTIKITVLGPSSPENITITLTIGTITGIIVGGTTLLIIIGIIAIYYIYQRILAHRFEKRWRKEWAQAHLIENPLYISNQKERHNPLYQPLDPSSLSISKTGSITFRRAPLSSSGF